MTDGSVRECEACGHTQVFLLSLKDSECGREHKFCEECLMCMPAEFGTKLACVLELPMCPIPWFVMHRLEASDQSDQIKRYVERYRRFMRGDPSAT